jgi:hypothetical protein
MKRLFWCWAPESLFGFALLGVLGCDPNQSVKAGPPVLKSYSVVDNGTGATYEVVVEGGVNPVPGFVHLSALFDRLLDPTTITTLDGSADVGAASVTFAFDPPRTDVTFTSIYTPNGGETGLVFPLGPTIATTASPTFPSSSTITATLDKTKVRSKAGEPFTGEGDLVDGRLVFHTLPFAATIEVPMGDAVADAGADAGPPPVNPQMQAVKVSFTNVPRNNIAQHITATVGGVVVPSIVKPDAGNNPTIYDVTPMTSWPANASVVITVDGTATDALGTAIDAATMASFTTGGA